MPSFKAVLFDASETIWYPRASPKGVWKGILEDLEFDVPTSQIDGAWEREWQLLEPQYLAFESLGHPNEPSAIESMWAASEARFVDGLGLTVDLNRLRRVADERFASNEDLYPETVEVLEKLSTMGKRMAIVSNGVNQERTAVRLGIDGYFAHVVGSVHVGFAKPHRGIFDLALSALDVSAEDAIMVGDNWEADVLGARGVGMRCLHVVRDDEDASGPNTISDLYGVIDLLTGYA